MFEKPGIKINQVFTSSAAEDSDYLNTTLIGPRYNVHTQESLGSYVAGTYSYPNQETSSIIDADYSKLYMQNLYLKYYTSAHTWRKVGLQQTYLRTILTDSLNLSTLGNYPHNPIFRDRGVRVNDLVDITVGTKSLQTYVTGFSADSTTSSIGAATANSGNQTTQSHSISAVTPGGSYPALTVTASGTYAGSLQDDVIEDTYTATLIESGSAPTIAITPPVPEPNTLTTNAIYSGLESDIYYLRIVVGGLLGTATYQIISNSGDNSNVLLTPLSGVATALGSKGLTFTFTGASSFTAGQEWKIEVTPSTAKFRVVSTSGTDDVSIVQFPGFATTFAIGTRGLLFSIAGSSLPLGYYWSVTCKKAVATVTAVSQGTYTGSSDINFFVKVIQGGTWGNCYVEVLGTSRKVLTVSGVGSANAISLESGVELYFNTNTQGGLVKDDIFSVIATAAKPTAYRTLITRDTLPAEADVCTVATPTYGGSNPTYNVLSKSGTYSAHNPGLELYSSERYTLTVTSAGDYGVAVITVSSLSGYDSGTITPVASGEAISYGNYGLILTFTGAQLFQVGDVWIITVTKPNITVNFALPLATTEIARQRVEDSALSAWTASTSNVTINSNIRLIASDWDTYSSLPIFKGDMLLTYRGLHTVGSNTIYSISSSSLIQSTLGTIHVDNPIAYAANLAIFYGASIKAIYPSSDNISGYQNAIKKLEMTEDVYRLVVLSFDTSVINAFISHANLYSTKNKWRTVYICRQLPSEIALTSGTATISINPADNNLYNLVTTTNSNFTVANIGDTFRYLNNDYTIKSIISQTQLTLNQNFGSPQPVASLFSIIRIPSTDELANLYAYYATSYANRRVVNVVPDNFTYDTTENVPGYYAAALIAGLRAALLPHQPITNVNITPITAVPNQFSEDQLDVIANGGNLILTQDYTGAPVYIRHQLTTDTSDVKHREITFTENLDDISYSIYDIVKPFIGKYNIHQGVLNQIEANIIGYLHTLMSSTDTAAGPQIISYSDLTLSSNADKVIISLTLGLPYPFNYAEITIIV